MQKYFVLPSMLDINKQEGGPVLQQHGKSQEHFCRTKVLHKHKVVLPLSMSLLLVSFVTAWNPRKDSLTRVKQNYACLCFIFDRHATLTSHAVAVEFHCQPSQLMDNNACSVYCVQGAEYFWHTDVI